MENDKIRVLPDGVANQIAAGEVVGRPGSVVKELMENSIDAGSHSVTVNYKEGGRALIQLLDDGCGMSETDARLAFERHATSKICSAADLYRLKSFGFRGEALPSIASVAEVELRTRTADRDLGTQVIIHGGRFIGQDPIQTQVGTQFLIKNLFYNVPARRRFLKEPGVEGRHIRNEFLRVALCNPQTSFSLYDNDIQVCVLPAANLRQRIVQAIGGREITKNLLDVAADTTIVRIEGFVGRPAAAKKTNREQYLFVNGRYFNSPYFRKAILQAYEKLMSHDTQPSYFLYLTIDPQRIDVNVHPQKTEIKFDDEQAIWQIINASVRESLGKLGVVPMMDFEMDSSIEIPVFQQGHPYKIPDMGVNPDFNPFKEQRTSSYGAASRPVESRVPEQWETLFEVEGGVSRDASGHPAQHFEEYDSAELEFINGSDDVQSRIEFEAVEAFSGVLRLNKRYCATRVEQGMVLVDIQRASEQVLFERYCTMLGNNASVTQQLLFPEYVPLTSEESRLMLEAIEEIESVGFDLRVDSQGVSVIGIPADLSPGAVEVTLRELLADLCESGGRSQERHNERLSAVMARHSTFAREGGEADECSVKRLLKDLFACRSFNYTASGTPIVSYITYDEIAKRFI